MTARTEAAAAGAGSPGRVRRLARRLLLSEYFVLWLAVATFLVVWPLAPEIATARNLANVLSNMWPLLAVAVGQTFVLLVAGIDLSQTSVMAVSSVGAAAAVTTGTVSAALLAGPLGGWLLTPGGGALAAGGLAVAVLLALALGALIGLGNGLAVTRLAMPPFMVTLVGLIFFRALAIYGTRSENITGLPEGLVTLGRGELFGVVPYPLLVAGGLAVAAHLVLSRTVFGRWVYAIGMNPRASRISGVPTARVVTAVYVISGVCAAIGGLLYTARLETARPTLAENLLLDIVGATVIGGTSLFGGKGKVLWTVFGVLFFTLLDNSLNLLRLSFFTVLIVKGAVILAAASLDVARTRLEGRA